MKHWCLTIYVKRRTYGTTSILGLKKYLFLQWSLTYMSWYCAFFFYLNNANNSKLKWKHVLWQFHNDIFTCNFTMDLSCRMSTNGLRQLKNNHFFQFMWLQTCLAKRKIKIRDWVSTGTASWSSSPCGRSALPTQGRASELLSLELGRGGLFPLTATRSSQNCSLSLSNTSFWGELKKFPNLMAISFRLGI